MISICFWILIQSFKAALLIVGILLLRLCFGRTLAPVVRCRLWLLVPLILCFPGFLPLNLYLPFLSYNNSSNNKELINSQQNQSVVVQMVSHDTSDITVSDITNESTGQNDITKKELPVTFDSFDLQSNDSFRLISSKNIPPSPKEPLEKSGYNLSSNTFEGYLTPLGVEKYITFVWILGMVIALLHFLRKMSVCRRLIGLSVICDDTKITTLYYSCLDQMSISRKRAPELLLTVDLSSPALTGIYRSKLLLPCPMIEKLSQEQLPHIFLHELAHFRHKDTVTGWITSIINIVHWFNPMMKYASSLLGIDLEEAADLMVLSKQNRIDRVRYAETLYEIVKGESFAASTPGFTGMISNVKQIQRRIKMMSQIGTWKKRWSVFVTLLAVTFAVATGSVTLLAKNELSQVKTAPLPPLDVESSKTESSPRVPVFDEQKTVIPPVVEKNDKDQKFVLVYPVADLVAFMSPNHLKSFFEESVQYFPISAGLVFRGTDKEHRQIAKTLATLRLKYIEEIRPKARKEKLDMEIRKVQEEFDKSKEAKEPQASQNEYEMKKAQLMYEKTGKTNYLDRQIELAQQAVQDAKLRNEKYPNSITTKEMTNLILKVASLYRQKEVGGDFPKGHEEPGTQLIVYDFKELGHYVSPMEVVEQLSKLNINARYNHVNGQLYVDIPRIQGRQQIDELMASVRKPFSVHLQAEARKQREMEIAEVRSELTRLKKAQEVNPESISIQKFDELESRLALLTFIQTGDLKFREQAKVVEERIYQRSRSLYSDKLISNEEFFSAEIRYYAFRAEFNSTDDPQGFLSMLYVPTKVTTSSDRMSTKLYDVINSAFPGSADAMPVSFQTGVSPVREKGMVNDLEYKLKTDELKTDELNKPLNARESELNFRESLARLLNIGHLIPNRPGKGDEGWTGYCHYEDQTAQGRINVLEELPKTAANTDQILLEKTNKALWKWRARNTEDARLEVNQLAGEYTEVIQKRADHGRYGGDQLSLDLAKLLREKIAVETGDVSRVKSLLTLTDQLLNNAKNYIDAGRIYSTDYALIETECHTLQKQFKKGVTLKTDR